MSNADNSSIDTSAQGPLLAALQDARRRLEQHQKERNERVAIIGMAGRFPGADDIDGFWEMLDAGETGLRPVDDDELTQAGVSLEQAAQPSYVRVWGGFDDPTGFDAAFFGYSPREAELLDPQQRVFLECAWSALEHSGYDSRSAARIGVYAGGALTNYLTHFQGHAALRDSVDPVQAAISNVNGMVASRVAYHLDLKGPSVGIQTTCSTSLVAVHTAARSLVSGECDMALAGGVAIGQPRPAGYLYQSEGINSPDGICRPFDAAAEGTIFTNGVGAVVLKRLSDAQAAGDTIYGVILGSAINNDGAEKVGLTAPSVAGQAAVLEAALSAAGVEPSSIDYIEGHGTATALGDPIEIAALNRVYGPSLKAAGTECALGSVKGNVGHLDAAAGVAGLIKTLLAMRHGRLPATANFTKPNPGCEFASRPFNIVDKRRDWPNKAGRPRRAAVSSFGLGGTNAHVVLEEPPALTATDRSAGSQLLTLSARTPESLANARQALATALDSDPTRNLADVAYTLQVGRRPMGERLICVANTAASAATALAVGDGPGLSAEAMLAGEPSLVFLFPGQGAQHVDMARKLYDHEPAFRVAFDECIALMPQGPDLEAILISDASGDPEALNQTEVAQPALFVVEYALAKMWLAKGLRPRALLGHSIGEYVAACIAGVFSLADALKVVSARGRLMQRCQPGAMLSVMLSEAEAKSALSPDVELAAVNAPRSCVLAGPREAIAALAEQFGRRGLGCRLLKTSHAFHTAMMEPALEEFAAVFADVKLNAPTIDIVSNLSGDWLTAQQATDPNYWVQHLRKAVQFGPGVGRLMQLPYPLLLEVGPGSALTRLVRQQLHDNARALASLPDAGSDTDPVEHALMALGRLWVAGLEIDWQRLHPVGQRRRVGLPTYRFARSSFWIPPAALGEAKSVEVKRSPNLPDWSYQEAWQRGPIGLGADAGASGARWLLLNGRAVLEALGDLPVGVDAVLVEAGETFTISGSVYTLDPTEPDHYGALFADLSGRGWQPEQIINGFGLVAEGSRPADEPGPGFASTLALGRALAGDMERPSLLTVLGRGMQQVSGAETLNPAAAMMLGLTKVLPQELPGLRCRSIDLDSDKHVAGLGEALLKPWNASATTLALRDGFLWLQNHAAAPIAEPEDLPLLKRGATYLIAGDLVEGLGLVYAAALVKQLGARLIVVGRAGLPPAAEWDRWLASHSPHHGISQLIRALRDVGLPGRDYVLYSGSLADPDWVKNVLDEGQKLLGPIHGAFHTAAMGEQYHCPLEQVTPDSYRALFETKIAGIKVLDQVLADTPAAFVLVQSSLSALVGGAGFAAYAAANAFLDAFVAARRGKAGPIWQSINWDACRTHQTVADGGSSLLADAFTADEVWRFTRAVLARSAIARLTATPVDLQQRLATAMNPPDRVASTSAPTASPRQGIRTAYVAPRDAEEDAVALVIGELLGIERVGVDDNFFELGGHSLLAIQVITRLRKQFEVDLPMRALLFEAPTVGGIAGVIREAIATAKREHETLAALLDNIESAVTPETAQEVA